MAETKAYSLWDQINLLLGLFTGSIGGGILARDFHDPSQRKRHSHRTDIEQLDSILGTILYHS
jgi:hypothetical protein